MKKFKHSHRENIVSWTQMYPPPKLHGFPCLTALLPPWLVAVSGFVLFSLECCQVKRMCPVSLPVSATVSTQNGPGLFCNRDVFLDFIVLAMISKKFFKIYLFIYFREREKEMERNIDPLPLTCPQPGTWP